MAEETPELNLPAHKVQEIAQLVWFTSMALQKARHAREAAKDRKERREEEQKQSRRVQAGRDALVGATEDPQAAANGMPRPIDHATFEQAEKIASAATERRVDVVPGHELGRSGYLVVGEVPTLGRVGVEVATHEQAMATRQMILTASASEIAQVAEAFAVTPDPVQSPSERPDVLAGVRDAYPDMVQGMDPKSPEDRAVARNLWLQGDPQVQAAVAETFGDLVNERGGLRAQATADELGLGTGGEAAAPPSAVRESLTTSSGSFSVFDPEKAMELYPAPDSSWSVVELRDAQGQLLEGDAADQALLEAIPTWDPENAEHRAFAARVHASKGEHVQEVLHNKFPGLSTAMSAHAERGAVSGGRDDHREAVKAAQASPLGTQEAGAAKATPAVSKPRAAQEKKARKSDSGSGAPERAPKQTQQQPQKTQQRYAKNTGQRPQR